MAPDDNVLSRPGALTDWIRGVAICLFALMVLGLFEPYYWTIYRTNRRGVRQYMTELPYSRMPGLRPFLTEVGRRTREGDSIAIWVPVRRWYRGYSYAYHRAFYLLPGRRVLPLIDEEDRFLSDNLRRADFIAEWHGGGVPPGFEVVWKDEDGTLLRRGH
jgi:hypothetical protein